MARDGLGVTFVQTQQITADGPVEVPGLNIVGKIGFLGPRRPAIQTTGRALTTPAARPGVAGSGISATPVAPGRFGRTPVRRALTRALWTARVTAPAEAALVPRSASLRAPRPGAPETSAVAVTGTESALRPLFASLPEPTIGPISTGARIAPAESPGPIVRTPPRGIRAITTAIIWPVDGTVTSRTTVGPASIGAPGIVTGVATAIGSRAIAVPALRRPVSGTAAADIVPSAVLTTEAAARRAGAAGASVPAGLAVRATCTAALPGPPESALRPGRIAPERFPAIVLFRHGGSLSR